MLKIDSLDDLKNNLTEVIVVALLVAHLGVSPQGPRLRDG